MISRRWRLLTLNDGWYASSAESRDGCRCAHSAIEGYITRGAWALTDALHIKRLKSLLGRCEDRLLVIRMPGRNGARAVCCGYGILECWVRLVHGMAHPLGAFYNTPHGVATPSCYRMSCAITLTLPMRSTRYRARYGRESGRYEPGRGANAAVEAVFALNRDVGIPPHFVMLVYARKTFRHWRRRHWMSLYRWQPA